MRTSAGLSYSARVNFQEAVLLISSKVLVHPPPRFLASPNIHGQGDTLPDTPTAAHNDLGYCHISPKVSLTPDQAYHFELFWNKDSTVKCIQCWTLGNPSNIREAPCGLALSLE